MVRRRRLKQLKVRWNPVTKKNELVLLEEHVVQEIIDRLWLQAKIKVYRINQPYGGVVRQNEVGIPDLMGWIPRDSIAERYSPIPLFIEVKRPAGPGRPGGVPSHAQIQFIDNAKKDGCIAFFADCWMDVVRELYAFGIKLTV